MTATTDSNKQRPKRCGLIGRKLGMSRKFTPDGGSSPVTLIQLEDVQVVAQREFSKDGYDAVVVGAGAARKLSKPQQGLFTKKPELTPKKKLAEFRVSADQLLPVGEKLAASHFQVGQKVDVCGTSIGRGFAGAMKRHNFAGLRASHGVSVSHRSHGSTGNNQNPGRVFKNKKMAGQMGNRRVTMQNLTVLTHDDEQGILLVSGAVPGATGAWLRISDAQKGSGVDILAAKPEQQAEQAG